eukprot:GILJ01000404.1.p1 GENE.GILJ01000404.1~~GILJ01000404.1.p1  ORF type:complete len:224 (-),score=58.93 GILJ01000404.1:237-908(-)
MNLFGKAKKKTVNPVDSIMQLRETLTTLEKRQLHIEKKIGAQLEEARAKTKAKDKRGALFALKRKKMYEAEVSKLDGARMTIETQILALENAQTNIMALDAMRMGTTAMKEAHNHLNIDQVDNIMEEIQEQQQLQEEIQQVLSQPIGTPMDDDELLEELNMMEQEDLEKQLLDTTSVPTSIPASKMPTGVPAMPSVPTKTPQQQQVEDDEARELRELEASMAM